MPLSINSIWSVLARALGLVALCSLPYLAPPEALADLDRLRRQAADAKEDLNREKVDAKEDAEDAKQDVHRDANDAKEDLEREKKDAKGDLKRDILR
jgi:F0F1-type ATP synthase membrane subunit b/b'